MTETGPVAIHFVHNAPPEDHDLKRQYLALLPAQQVVDICLALDLHVPVALKRNIWPADFRATIASMQGLTPKVESTADVGPSNPAQAADDKPKQPSSEPKAPDKQPEPAAGPSKPPVPTLQPYSFSQPVYPHHTPYYQALPPGFGPYSYPPYPAGAHGFPATTFPAAHGFPATVYPQRPHPLFTPAQDTTVISNPTGDTDLPSYEDMIVECLITVSDPEGMAPKEIFNWMAGRYPVQSNFRPSASQALQKALKRGRFYKSPNGRYFLNALWDGGNSTTRRATRRPQAITAVPTVQKARVNAVPSPQPAPAASQPAVAPPTPAEAPKQAPPIEVPLPPPSVPPNDAYAAAQKILQTINFVGGMFESEDGEARVASPVKSEAVSMSLADHARAELQAQLALLAAQLQEIAQDEEEAAAVLQEDEDEDMEEVV
ncbi:hypothetical protein B0H16DRAFT_1494786 [Mycena metata]|uniref:Histone H1 n=1 Tax=Mycena metata TaxID=1033252 RepID=A0AAD7KCQ1_9AGAR|nr:hypothetical protein B0H16DRAFT_1494786 [Mycena metata]